MGLKSFTGIMFSKQGFRAAEQIGAEAAEQIAATAEQGLREAAEKAASALSKDGVFSFQFSTRAGETLEIAGKIRHTMPSTTEEGVTDVIRAARTVVEKPTKVPTSFPRASEFPEFEDLSEVYGDLSLTQRKELKQLLAELKKAEEKCATATRAEQSVVNGLYNPATQKGFIKYAYDDMLPREDLSKMSEEMLEKYIATHLSKFAEYDKEFVKQPTKEGYGFYQVVRDYYRNTHRIGTPTNLSLEHARNMNSYRVRTFHGQSKPEGYSPWLKGKDASTGKDVYYAYMEDEAVAYVDKAVYEQNQVIFEEAKAMFDKAGEYTAKKHRLAHIEINPGDRFFTYVPGKGNVLTQKGQKFVDKVAREYNKQHPIGTVKNLSLEHARNIKSYVERESVGQAVPKGCVSWKTTIDPLTGKRVTYTYMENDAAEYVEKAVEKQREAILAEAETMFNNVIEERNTIEKEIEEIIEQSPIYTHATNTVAEKTVRDELSEIQAKFLEKYGDLKIGKHGETLRELSKAEA